MGVLSGTGERELQDPDTAVTSRAHHCVTAQDNAMPSWQPLLPNRGYTVYYNTLRLRKLEEYVLGHSNIVRFPSEIIIMFLSLEKQANLSF